MTETPNPHPEITVAQIPEALELCASGKRPPIFISNPGLGKTQSIMTFAASRGAELRTFVTSMMDRVDFQLPLLDAASGVVKFVPLEDLKDLSVEHNPRGEPVVLYWNEYTLTPDNLHGVLYRLINERRIGKLTLRDNVFNVADGNPSSCSNASDLPFPARRRWRWYFVKSDTPSWLEWANDAGIDGRIRGFISNHPHLLSDFSPDKFDAATYASPAGYEYLSNSMSGLDSVAPAVALSTICGDIGLAAGMQFSAFLAHRDKLGDIADALRNPETCMIPKERDTLFLFCGIVLNKATEVPAEFAGPACILGSRILSESRESGVFLIRSLLKTKTLTPIVKQTSGYRELVRLTASDRALETALFN